MQIGAIDELNAERENKWKTLFDSPLFEKPNPCNDGVSKLWLISIKLSAAACFVWTHGVTINSKCIVWTRSIWPLQHFGLFRCLSNENKLSRWTVVGSIVYFGKRGGWIRRQSCFEHSFSQSMFRLFVSIFLISAVLVWWTDSCSCRAPTTEQRYNVSEFGLFEILSSPQLILVSHVKIINKSINPTSHMIVYDVEHLQILKVCNVNCFSPFE